jgi:hypothetical protein
MDTTKKVDKKPVRMNPEKEGKERSAEEKAIAVGHRRDLEHLRNNVHPSLRDSISLGDSSGGSGHSISDYATLVLRDEIDAIKKDITWLKRNLESLRLQIMPDATPEDLEEKPDGTAEEVQRDQQISQQIDE